MANEFKIKKGLIVDGAGTVLQVKAANSTILLVNDSKDGSLLAVPNADGFAILSVSGSSVEMGLLTSEGTRPLRVAEGKVYLTGSAQLTNLTISGSLIQGLTAIASGDFSHAQGTLAKAIGHYSHAEGSSTEARGVYSHAEGVSSLAIGDYSHAEGNNTDAIGVASHAEGQGTFARGDYSHAEGNDTTAQANYSHAQGQGTIASALYQHVVGQFNATSTHTSSFIVGNGTGANDRRNLIHAYGAGSNGVVEINGVLKVVDGEILGATLSTNVVSSSNNTGTHIISNLDNKKIILFRNTCTASLTSELASNFECTIVSVAGNSVRFITGSDITFLNNTGNTLPSKLSVTIRQIEQTKEYITSGGL